MTENINNLLYKNLRNKGFKPSHVTEVGVWHPETSNVYQYIEDGIRTTLIEPDPTSIKLLKSRYSNKSNVALHEVAICDFNGEVELYKRESSTFVSTLPSSPSLVNDNIDIQNDDKFTAEAKLFSEIDDGTIDLLSVDIEGSEWFVIKNMKSRPAVLSIETHGGMYINPYIDKILNWANENNYVLWFKDKSDSVFVLNNVITVSFGDKVRLRVYNIFIFIKSIKKKIGKILKKSSISRA